MHVAESLIGKNDDSFLSNKVTIVDLLDEDTVFGLGFNEFLCSFLALTFQILGIISYMFLVQYLKILAEFCIGIEEAVIHLP